MEAIDYYKTFVDKQMDEARETVCTPPLMETDEQKMFKLMETEELEMFKKWRDTSVFKCAICHWTGSVTYFHTHVRKVHFMQYGVYRGKYGTGLYQNNEHQCEICHKKIGLDYLSVHHHFKTKHCMKPLEYYKMYVSGEADRCMLTEDE